MTKRFQTIVEISAQHTKEVEVWLVLSFELTKNQGILKNLQNVNAEVDKMGQVLQTSVNQYKKMIGDTKSVFKSASIQDSLS